MKCPRCQAKQKQYKAGFNPSGSQRYRCGICNRVYTPQPTPKGYPSATRMLALRLYVEGNSQRAIGRIRYYSDAFPVYDTLYYGAPYEMRTDKDESYSVEAVNADLRHYL